MDEERGFPFEFSIIMSVYNVEPWIREAVDSIIAQDFGLERVQIVMVDDGSTDGSGAICDEYAARYPKNVLVVHKENGGLSSARNAGVRVATGRYLNFFDPDDLLDKQVLSSVHSFFRAHEDETDVVSIPMMLFGNQTGEHILNNKFKKGNRVINLEEEWALIQMSVATAFFRSEVAKKYCFKEDLEMATAEDAREMVNLLLHNHHLGVVSDGYYRYRKRSGSQLTTASYKRTGYVSLLQDFSQWACKYAVQQIGYVPKFIQNMVMYELQGRIKEQILPIDIVGEEDSALYIQLVKSILTYIDDDVIIAQKGIYPEHKAWALEQKYGKRIQYLQLNRDVLLAANNRVWFSLNKNRTVLEFLKIKNGLCSLEGYSIIYPVHDKNARVKIEINGKRYPCEIVERNHALFALGEPISYWLGFRGTFPLCRADEKYNIKLIVEIGDFFYQSQNLNVGKFFPVNRKYGNAYYIHDGWKVSMGKGNLMIRSCGRKGHIISEWKFLKELWKKNGLGNRKAVLARLAYYMLKLFKRKPIWLISDRIVKADDNGEALFRYMQKEHGKEIKSYFVISKDSSDFECLKKLGPVVNNLSWKHKMLFLLCDYNISAQADAITTNPFPGYEDGVRDIESQQRFIFLQHGVTQNDISNWLNRYNKNIYGFVTTAYPEHQSILNGNYFYDEDRIWLTGFPRFDRRYHEEKNYITIMPTWRLYLMEAADKSSGLRELKPGFKESAYFKFYQGLLNDQKLIAAAGKSGYRLRFLAHPNIQPHLSEFNIDPNIDVLSIDTKYNDVYAQSNLVVTDYSSACFDFAYLRKPIIYCQFDAEEFFAGEHVCTRGYFDYERDGFGEVEYDLEHTVDRIIEYMENGCKLKDKYRERIDKFFAFNDQNSCQRLYEKIVELEQKENGKQ